MLATTRTMRRASRRGRATRRATHLLLLAAALLCACASVRAVAAVDAMGAALEQDAAVPDAHAHRAATPGAVQHTLATEPARVDALQTPQATASSSAARDSGAALQDARKRVAVDGTSLAPAKLGAELSPAQLAAIGVTAAGSPRGGASVSASVGASAAVRGADTQALSPPLANANANANDVRADPKDPVVAAPGAAAAVAAAVVVDAVTDEKAQDTNAVAPRSDAPSEAPQAAAAAAANVSIDHVEAHLQILQQLELSVAQSIEEMDVKLDARPSRRSSESRRISKELQVLKGNLKKLAESLNGTLSELVVVEKDSELKSKKLQEVLEQQREDEQEQFIEENGMKVVDYETGHIRNTTGLSSMQLQKLEAAEKKVDPAVLHYDFELLGQIAILLGVAAIGGIVATYVNVPPNVGYLLGGALVAAAMTFAKCIGGEPERVFASPTAREMPPGRLKMRQLLGWTRGGSNNSKTEVPSPQQMAQSPVVRDVKVPAATPPSLSPVASSSKVSERAKPADASAAPLHVHTEPQSQERSQQSDDPEDNNAEEASNKSSAAQQEQDQQIDCDDQQQEECAEGDDEFAPPPPPSVIHRKGEKSFLDFHQHYAITRHLGEGSYSTVKQVTHRKKGGFFACKIVDKAALSAVDRAALSQEVHVLSRVSHDNIMRLHEVIEDDSKCYLVTELAENGDLFDKIVKQGKFPQREAQKVVGALTEALYYCHSKNIIHRDIKPENVLLSGDNVKLCDFGFAKQLSDRSEQSVDSCGTPGYAAPEILDGKPYGLEVDVFSLGVVAYIMLCGYPPFPMKLSQLRTHRFNVRFPSKDWGHIDPSVKELISKMLHITPSHRPSAAYLRAHPWVRQGKDILDQLRREAEERKRLADFTRKQQAADGIRKKLAMGGFEVVKYGRNGLPHRTKLRLSNDGKSITWQPKLLKRSLLRYQNARSFTSLFGISKDSTSQPQLHAHPQVDRLSMCESAVSRRSNEPSTDDSSSNNNSSSSHDASDEHRDSDVRESTLESNGSNSSTTSCASDTSTSEKKLWWKSFRRDRGKAERTASGGFSLSFSSATRSSASSFDGSSATESASRTSSVGAAPVAKAAPEKLDDAIHLHDIRSMATGDQSDFFAAHKLNLPNGCKRAVDPACVLSVTTRFRDLHLEFQSEELRDGFAYLLEQATLPLHKPVAPERQRYANVSRVASSRGKDDTDAASSTTERE